MVFPESMKSLDLGNTKGSLKTIEDYITYMQERIDFSVSHLRADYITVGEIGGANGISIGDGKISFGSDCEILWSSISDKPLIPTVADDGTYITTINSKGIATSNILANSVFTNSFKIGLSESNPSMTFNGSTGAITFGSNVTMNWSQINGHTTVDNNISNAAGLASTAYSTASTALSQSANSVKYNTKIGSTYVITDSLEAQNLTITGGTIALEASSPGTYITLVATSSGTPTTEIAFADIKVSQAGSYSEILPTTIYEGGTALSSKYADKSAESTASSAYSLASSKYGEDSSPTFTNTTTTKLFVTTSSTTTNSPDIASMSSDEWRVSSSSSRKIKHDIKDVANEELNADKLYELPVRQFKFNNLDESDTRYGKDCIGFIAEEMADVYPIGADYTNGEPSNWNVRFILPAMLKLIQEQNERLKVLENAN